MRSITVAATQMSCSWSIPENIQKAERLVETAAAQGAQIILLQELFETVYFCQEKRDEYRLYAGDSKHNPAVQRFTTLAKKHHIVLPVSFYERDNGKLFNSIAMIDADGSLLGIYRKTHIPDGPGYEEKYFFEPGDSGFKVWETRYGRIGVGICWDQWFPEAARCMTLMGAELLLYPTAIGSEPHEPTVDSKDHWQRCMQGHAAANLVPVVASNRIGTETVGNSSITFYGSSFIADATGAKIVEADRTTETVITATFDLDQLVEFRRYWGVFKDRRPEMYGDIQKI